SEPDELLGVVAALDSDALTLEHAVVGKLVIPRPRLVSLRPLFHGTRIELKHKSHLGPAGTKVPGAGAVAQGTSVKHSFKLDALPREATVALSVGYPGTESDSTRCDVLINGAKVEALERHVRRGASELRQVRIALTADAFRVGDNALEFRLSSAADRERLGHCV